MRRFYLLVAALLVISACNLNNSPATPTNAPTPELPQPQASAAPSPTPQPSVAVTIEATRTPFGSNPPTVPSIAATSAFPTPASGERAEIVSPTNGASVTGSPLLVSGVVHNLSEDKFTLQVFDANQQPLTSEQTIALSNPNHVADVPWSASVLLRAYSGAAQIRISTRLADGTTAVIATADVTIVPGTPASVVQPTNGATAPGSPIAAITSPTDGMSVTGNPFTVTGTAGGIADNQFTLLLLTPAGTVLNRQLITLTGAETNAVPWSASLGTSAYHGTAEIRAVILKDGKEVTIASITVNLQ